MASLAAKPMLLFLIHQASLCSAWHTTLLLPCAKHIWFAFCHVFEHDHKLLEYELHFRYGKKNISTVLDYVVSVPTASDSCGSLPTEEVRSEGNILGSCYPFRSLGVRCGSSTPDFLTIDPFELRD
jgi:hypothetical protein